MKKTTVVASVCRTKDEENILREIVGEELGEKTEVVELLVPRNKKAYQKHLPKAEVLFAYRLPTEHKTFLDLSSRLKWVHIAAAGVDASLDDSIAEHAMVITNSRGMHAQRVAEYVLGSIIAYSKGFLKALRIQRLKRWARSELIQANRTLAGKTLGLFGLGALGQQIARVAHPFGLEILALRRHPEAHPKPPEVRHVFGPQNMREFIHPLDYLVLCAPLTRETHHIIDHDELVRLKTSALLINVSRGALVDEQALLRSLKEGELGGAVLDVFETEPLQQDSPLWGMDNVFVTPHVAGTWPGYVRDASRVFARNLRLYLEDRPLENVIDKARGY